MSQLYATRFAPQPFTELPHIGSRNLREGRLSKLYYSCTAEAPPDSPKPLNPAGFEEATAAAAGPGVGGGAEVLLYLVALPAAAQAWHGERRRAFRELCEAISAAEWRPCHRPSSRWNIETGPHFSILRSRP